MNFAYIDAQSIFESLIRPEPNIVQSIPCDIEEDWVTFEKELGKFKDKYAREQVELAQKVHELNEKLRKIQDEKQQLHEQHVEVAEGARGDAAQGAQHRPAGVDELQLAVAAEGLGVFGCVCWIGE